MKRNGALVVRAIRHNRPHKTTEEDPTENGLPWRMRHA